MARGSRRRIITAAKRRGLNSVLRQRRAICLRSRRTPRLAFMCQHTECNVDEAENYINKKYQQQILTSGSHILYPNQE